MNLPWDWISKAALTACAVAWVLVMARALGVHIAGLLAGLPVVTAPALAWMTHTHGVHFAAHSAVGSLTACGAMALFAVSYERLSQQRGPGTSFAAGLAAALLLAVPLQALVEYPVPALLAALALGVFALFAMPAAGLAAAPARRLRGELPVTAAVAGIVSVGATSLAGVVGPYWAGMLTALPLISGAVLVNLHLTRSQPEVRRFLRGYVGGLMGKAVFALTFALVVTELPLAAALGLALATGLTAGVAITRGVQRLERRAPAAPPPGRLAVGRD